MPDAHHISEQWLSLDQLDAILQSGVELKLSEEATQRIQHCRNYLDLKVKGNNELIYGVNTGFGSLCDVQIAPDQIEQLQHNLVVSHACGMGDEVPADIVRIMLLLKAQSLSYGHSGSQVATVQRLVDFYNKGVLPVVYEVGSLGASGDLAPLAHLSLPLFGEGEVILEGEKHSGACLNARYGWAPLQLQSKEGLALLNGTQFMSAYGTYILMRSKKLFQLINQIAALSVDAYDCKLSPFEPHSHSIRGHQGQIETAQSIMHWLSDSQIAHRDKAHVQDPYSFRCIPQVHGASWGVLQHVEEVFTREINSVTDNPNVFPDEDRIISAGNFHGQPLAMALDYLAIALAELGSISERRTFLMQSGKRGLPAFLIKESGLNSGFMIPQYTAAALASQNKQLCTPASVDSIDSSNSQENHVSMGANAATKCYKVYQNLERILAIELMTAAQAMEFRRPAKSGTQLEVLLQAYRSEVPALDKDRIMYTDMDKSLAFIRKSI